MNTTLTRLFQKRIAEGAVGPSSLRNQGSARVVGRAREYLKQIDLAKFAVRDEARFRALLNTETRALQRSLPVGSRHWGTARKALNLFLRDVLYHSYLRPLYRFDRIEKWLEVPLDSYVAKAIRADGARAGHSPCIPKWRGIKHVTPDESFIFQEVTRGVARRMRIAPVHLDVYWWRRLGLPRGASKAA